MSVAARGGTYEFLLPDLGEGIAEAEVIAWHAEPGDAVKAHQVLVEVQTDKAMVELPSPVDGVLVAHGAAVGEMIAHEGVVATFTTAAVAGDQNGQDTESREAAGDPRTPAPPPAPAPTPTGGPRPLAAPMVRKLAKELSVDLATVTGTGPGDRITRQDVERAASVVGSAAPARVDAPAAQHAEDSVTRIPLRGLRRAIARKMSETWHSVPSVSNLQEVDVTDLEQILAGLQPVVAGKGFRLTWTSLFALALVRALADFPQLNATFDEATDEIVQHHNVNLGIAAAVPDGLIVPVVRHAQTLSLIDLAAAIARAGEKARNGAATRAELTGGTFTLTNYGAVGGWLGTPMVNLPEIAIAGFGRVETRAAVVGGAVVPRRIVAMSTSADHRVIDGAVLAQFCSAVRSYLERPYLLMLGMSHGDG